MSTQVLVRIQLRAPSLVVPTFDTINVALGDSAMRTVTFINDASATAELVLSFSVSPTAMMSLRQPVTNEAVASISAVTVKVGETFQLKVEAFGTQVGLHQVPVEMVSNDVRPEYATATLYVCLFVSAAW